MSKCVVNQVKTPNCPPNVSVSQYKNPCVYLRWMVLNTMTILCLIIHLN